MYNIAKSIIESGRFELKTMLQKIDALWLQGELSDAQRNELVEKAQGNANPNASIDVLKKLEELDRRVRELEVAQKEDASEIETYPIYAAGTWYYKGNKISFDGKNYVCIAPDGQVCTWNPVEYPAYWQVLD